MQLRWILVVPGLAAVDLGSAEWDSETFEYITSAPGPPFLLCVADTGWKLTTAPGAIPGRLYQHVTRSPEESP